jgi:hypothetical protein
MLFVPDCPFDHTSVPLQVELAANCKVTELPSQKAVGPVASMTGAAGVIKKLTCCPLEFPEVQPFTSQVAV